MAHFWMALHAHRRVDPRQLVLVAEHVDQGCAILRGVLTPVVASNSPKAAKKVSPKVARAPSGRNKTVVPPMTPKRRPPKGMRSTDLPRIALSTTLALQEIAIQPQPQDRKVAVLVVQDPDQLIKLISITLIMG